MLSTCSVSNVVVINHVKIFCPICSNVSCPLGWSFVLSSWSFVLSSKISKQILGSCDYCVPHSSGGCMPYVKHIHINLLNMLKGASKDVTLPLTSVYNE
jgi:urea transporter